MGSHCAGSRSIFYLLGDGAIVATLPYSSIDRTQAAFERACAGKDEYPSESAADAALAYLKRGTIRHPKSGGRWDTLNSYECQFCKMWHHGHP